ncbi:MAG: hypothetical protein DME45_13545 [Verrucomicrobia bacterium]|nr:MAG: hypothetical protein DME45_13545 [Verrucomicrobiota bacterium]
MSIKGKNLLGKFAQHLATNLSCARRFFCSHPFRQPERKRGTSHAHNPSREVAGGFNTQLERSLACARDDTRFGYSNSNGGRRGSIPLQRPEIYRPARQNYSHKNDTCFSPIALLRERVPQSNFGWQTGARTQVYPQ